MLLFSTSVGVWGATESELLMSDRGSVCYGRDPMSRPSTAAEPGMEIRSAADLFSATLPCLLSLLVRSVLLNRRQKEAEKRADAAEGQLNKLQTEMQTARDVSKGWRVLSFFPPEVLSRRLHSIC